MQSLEGGEYLFTNYFFEINNLLSGDFPWLATAEDWDSEINKTSSTATTTTKTIADDTNGSDDYNNGEFNQPSTTPRRNATGESSILETSSTAWGDSSPMNSNLSSVPLLPDHPGMKGENLIFVFRIL